MKLKMIDERKVTSALETKKYQIRKICQEKGWQWMKN